MTGDTIVALSSGRPPAAIGVVRLSGSAALAAAAALAGSLPPPRRAGLRALREEGALLDRALVLVFPGPASATGEDLVELHIHGGRAVVAAVEAALCRRPGVRRAEPGEFTRRALANGRLDLAQAEGLADLLEAETDAQRRAALAASEGQVSRAVRGWLERIVAAAALVELGLDHAEEDEDGEPLLVEARRAAAALRREIASVLARPPVERLRDGVRVVIGGPPNAGKSTLLNLMAAREAAIVSPVSGTTRDRIEAPVVRAGIAYLLTDTAGLTEAADPVERIGVGLAEAAIGGADVLLWLGDETPPRADALWLHARADLPGRDAVPAGRVAAVRQDRPEAVEAVWRLVETSARALLPDPDAMALKERQRAAAGEAAALLALPADPLLAAEQLRGAGRVLGTILGVDAGEAMLDALFARFCLGK